MGKQPTVRYELPELRIHRSVSPVDCLCNGTCRVKPCAERHRRSCHRGARTEGADAQLNSTLYTPKPTRDRTTHGTRAVFGTAGSGVDSETTPLGVPPSVAAAVVALSLRIAPLPSGGIPTLRGTPPLRHACGLPRRPSGKMLGPVVSPGPEEAAAAAPWPPYSRGPSGRRPGDKVPHRSPVSPSHATPGSAPCGGRRAGWSPPSQAPPRRRACSRERSRNELPLRASRARVSSKVGGSFKCFLRDLVARR